MGKKGWNMKVTTHVVWCRGYDRVELQWITYIGTGTPLLYLDSGSHVLNISPHVFKNWKVSVWKEPGVD